MDQMDNADGTEELYPRAYQIEMYEQALKSNTILYLPTGAGKTYIAVMVIKKLSGDLMKSYREGGKRTVFLVGTVPLAKQQSKYIQRNTTLSCGAYTGEMNVDHWSDSDWCAELEKHQVLVMTAQIFYNILSSKYMSLERVNLLIFDECHAAVENHPMREIMRSFAQCIPEHQPRVLALTACLLNSNIKKDRVAENIETLEKTFHAKVATVNSWEGLQQYYAAPKENVVCYSGYHVPNTKVLGHLNAVHEILTQIELECDVDMDRSYEFRPRSLASKLSSVIENFKCQFLNTGIYGANKCLLLYLVELERLKKRSTDTDLLYTLEYIVTEFSAARMMFENEMGSCSELERIYKYSSDKIIKLFCVLKDFHDYCNTTGNSKFCCIIFVEQRITAKILYHVLKSLCANDENFKFLSPDYISGSSTNPLLESKEAVCATKWNNDAIHRFRRGLSNCMIGTSIIDEGMDIPACSLVVRYDRAANVRAYIQGKGRARHAHSQYTLLVKEGDQEYLEKHKQFKETEQCVKNLLLGKTETRQLPEQEEIIAELYTTDIEPYVINCKDGTKTVLAETRAIQLINDYCIKLLKSKFICLTPTWKLYKLDTDKYMVSLQLPIASRCKEIIYGDAMSSIKKAKRSAAMKMCIELHKMGELTDNLRPVTAECAAMLDNTQNLLPHWKDETASEFNKYAASRRPYRIESPQSLYEAFPLGDKPLYLHVIHAKPTYSVPHDNRNKIFHDLLSKNAGFALLSTKRMPKIPSFPIFMNVGELQAMVKVNYATLRLTEREIKKITVFHSLIFTQIVPIVKSFMVFDVYNLDNCYLITPVNDKWDIDWDTINTYQSIRRETPTVPFTFRNRDYDMTLVTPNYRGSANVYIVTQICDDLTPKSCFPTDNFASYVAYYDVKHGLKIQDLSQPMLEVKSVSNKINCINPGNSQSGLSRRKRGDQFEDYLEHLVPELCTRVVFPSFYWLKATMLPSVLHRISQLLTAEELRVTIAHEARLGVPCIPEGQNWPSLNATENENTEEEFENLQEEIINDKIEESALTREPDSASLEVDVLDVETNLYPWLKEEEPVDLERNIEQIQIIDIEYYCQFMAGNCTLREINDGVHFLENSIVQAPSLRVFTSMHNTNGPDPVQIAHALTAKCAHDMFNLERLETLGDSYLKFIVSLFLYTTLPTLTEGVLTELKGKIIGNRNLYYCGCKKNLPGRMKIDEFTPRSSVVPAFATFRPLQKILLENEVSPSVLYELSIPPEEQMRGHLSEKTLNGIQQMVCEWNAPVTQTGMEHYLGVQSVGSKDVADCVEALTGVYLMSMGVTGAASLLSWFGLLPKTVDVDKLLNKSVEGPLASAVNEHLPWVSQIETSLGYKFKNRAYLLQAFTHPSYMGKGISESYQRLEFLGDAIIDFLITAYIYENCGDLTPGELTDLRSALVNNITFACLTTRFRLHTGLLAFAPAISKSVDRFVKFQEERNHAVDDTLLSVLLEEDDCNLAEYVDVPKVLGDLFESTIGAIYLDVNKDLEKVWQILYSLMQHEIAEFSADVPKNPIRKIYETQGARPEFCNAILVDGGNTCMVPLNVTISGKVKRFYGFGTNKKFAKCAAAKQALKSLMRDKIM